MVLLSSSAPRRRGITERCPCLGGCVPHGSAFRILAAPAVTNFPRTESASTGRVPVEADSVRGKFVTAGAARIRNALPWGTQPPRQGQRSVIPLRRGADDERRTIDLLSRAPRRSSQVLLPKGRMRT